jgi:hypothetical protein
VWARIDVSGRVFHAPWRRQQRQGDRPHFSFTPPQVRHESTDDVNMDVSAIASLSTQMSQQQTLDAAQLLVLKKTMDLQASSAMTLIDAVTPSANLPPHLGQNVNTVA